MHFFQFDYIVENKIHLYVYFILLYFITFYLKIKFFN